MGAARYAEKRYPKIPNLSMWTMTMFPGRLGEYSAVDAIQGLGTFGKILLISTLPLII